MSCIFQAAAVLAALAHPGHLHVSSLGWARLPPCCNLKSFGHSSLSSFIKPREIPFVNCCEIASAGE
ncbi:hypothetical protein C5938_17780 [Cronobacter sakazakii]|nr:hypothetical protein C3D68_19885 [Cronobacter sakazakii]PRO51801.1 hypothetical protein C5938_17780 [Cronobacter sakazakii]